MGIALVIMFFVFLFLGMPIGFVLGVVAVVGLIGVSLESPTFLLSVAPRSFFEGINSFPLMAMPFFTLAGEIMNEVGITERIINFCNLLVGRLRGGLAHVNIVASIIFAGLTGSAVADAAALGSVLIPGMVKEKYDKTFAAAVVASASIIGPIIPPSIIMVIYGSLMGVSIAGMFAAGIIPGLIIGILLMIVARFMSVKRNYPTHHVDFSIPVVFKAFKEVIVALLMPVIILGGILAGIFTPTEAAAIAVFYAGITGFFYFKTLTFQKLAAMLKRTAILNGVILFIISTSTILGWLIARERVPQEIVSMIFDITRNRYLILLIINVVFLIAGCFMETAPALIILAPILAPLAINAGVDPLHVGIIITINLNIGLITPPVGACLFVVCSIGKISLWEVSKEIWPFFIALFVALMIITYVPYVVLVVPRFLGFI